MRFQYPIWMTSFFARHLSIFILKTFDQSDSVYIFRMSASCKIHKFGFAKNEDEDLIILTWMQTSVLICVFGIQERIIHGKSPLFLWIIYEKKHLFLLILTT